MALSHITCYEQNPLTMAEYRDKVYGALTVAYTKFHNKLMIYKGYEYMQAGKGTAEYIWYRCKCQKEHKCQARIKVSRDEPFTLLGESHFWHNHMPKHVAQLLADEALRKMIVAAAETRESYTTIYSRYLSLVPREPRVFV